MKTRDLIIALNAHVKRLARNNKVEDAGAPEVFMEDPSRPGSVLKVGCVMVVDGKFVICHKWV